jgi:hypothetical protein
LLPAFHLEHHDPYDYFPLNPTAKPSQMGLVKFLPNKNIYQTRVLQSDEGKVNFLKHKKTCLGPEQKPYFLAKNSTLNIDHVLSHLSDIIHPNQNLLLSPEAITKSIQEDWVIHCQQSQTNWAELISVCFPNGWSANQMIGKSFDEIHTKVPNIKKIVNGNQTQRMIQAIIKSKYYFERIGAISFNTSPNLIRHPSFKDPRPLLEDPIRELYIRFERQVCKGFYHVGTDRDSPPGFLFLIKTYCLNIKKLNRYQLKCVRRTINENEKTLYYHRWIAEHQEQLSRWIDRLINLSVS